MDYKLHYRIDSDFVVPPGDLPAAQRVSEQRRLETIVRAVKTRIGGRILDVGCGSGWLAGMMADGGLRVVATDISPGGVRKAGRWTSGPSFSAADIYDLPFAAGTFRGVILSEVVEHLGEPGTALREVRRVLETGGHMLLTVPLEERIRQTLCIHCNRPTPVNAHLWSFSRQQIHDLLASEGLAPKASFELSNRLLEHMRFPWITRWAPHLVWRLGDRIANKIGHGAYLCVLARKG